MVTLCTGRHVRLDSKASEDVWIFLVFDLLCRMACSWAAVQWWRVASPAGGRNVLWTKTLRGRWCSSLGAAMTAPPGLEQDCQQGRQQVHLVTWRTYCFHGRPHNDSCIQMISRKALTFSSSPSFIHGPALQPARNDGHHSINSHPRAPFQPTQARSQLRG